MTTLIVSLPLDLNGTATTFEYVLTPDGVGIAQHAQVLPHHAAKAGTHIGEIKFAALAGGNLTDDLARLADSALATTSARKGGRGPSRRFPVHQSFQQAVAREAVGSVQSAH